MELLRSECNPVRLRYTVSVISRRARESVVDLSTTRGRRMRRSILPLSARHPHSRSDGLSRAPPYPNAMNTVQ
jgi:hypothetical protein